MMPDDTTNSEELAAFTAKRKFKARKAKKVQAKKAQARDDGLPMPDELREGKLPPLEFLRKVVMFLAHMGIAGPVRVELERRMHKTLKDLGRTP
jgi:hypothetical protein